MRQKVFQPLFAFILKPYVFLCCRLKRQPYQIITGSHLCQQLFSCFQKFFQDRLSHPMPPVSLLFFFLCRRISDSLLIIALHTAEVNTFWPLFLKQVISHFLSLLCELCKLFAQFTFIAEADVFLLIVSPPCCPSSSICFSTRQKIDCRK